jgi:quercetin dioxygenase-like cupin family protein
MSSRPPAVPTVQIDNERLRVTEWRFAPGAATGWHRHEHDDVIVPLTDGTLRLVEPDGERRFRAPGRRPVQARGRR